MIYGENPGTDYSKTHAESEREDEACLQTNRKDEEIPYLESAYTESVVTAERKSVKKWTERD